MKEWTCCSGDCDAKIIVTRNGTIITGRGETTTQILVLSCVRLIRYDTGSSILDREETRLLGSSIRAVKQRVSLLHFVLYNTATVTLPVLPQSDSASSFAFTD